MREIKFRAWNKDDDVKEIVCWEIILDDGFDKYYSNPNTVLMQFTGLHDKNGKEVYEGDIVEINRLYKGQKTIFECKWNERNACFDNCWGTVIGNIYENEDLL